MNPLAAVGRRLFPMWGVRTVPSSVGGRGAEVRVERFADHAAFDDFVGLNGEFLQGEQAADDRLAELESGRWALPGRCSVCDRASRFLFGIGAQEPNFREDLICTGCRLNARQRAALTLANDLMRQWARPRIYLTEQVSRVYRWLSERGDEVTGSEYFSARQVLSLHIRLIRMGLPLHRPHREDITSLSFGDESFDLLLSFDVLEHVPDYRTALREFFRVLKPSGRLVLTVPFRSDLARTLVRASLNEDGTVSHHVEPEYHGDPLASDGVLAFYDFGWDLTAALVEAGFEQAHWCLVSGRGHGFPAHEWVLIAHRQ
jgi:SAM-dependent methyltransferase